MFCFISVKRTKFTAYNKKFPAHINKKEKRSAYEIFYATCKQGL